MITRCSFPDDYLEKSGRWVILMPWSIAAAFPLPLAFTLEAPALAGLAEAGDRPRQLDQALPASRLVSRVFLFSGTYFVRHMSSDFPGAVR